MEGGVKMGNAAAIVAFVKSCSICQFGVYRAYLTLVQFLFDIYCCLSFLTKSEIELWKIFFCTHNDFPQDVTIP